MTRFQAEFQGLQMKYPGKNIQDSTIRLESKFQNNKQDFVFVIQNNRGDDFPDDGPLSFQNKLDRNNVFRALEYRIAIYERDLVNPENSKELIYAPLTSYFTAGTNFAPTDLEWFYQNGKIQVKVDTTEYLSQSLHVGEFRRVPQTQVAAAAPNDGFVTQTPANAGYRTMNLPINFFGDKQNDIRIICPVPPGIQWEQDAANKELRVVLSFKGLEVWDGSAVKQ